MIDGSLVQSVAIALAAALLPLAWRKGLDAWRWIAAAGAAWATMQVAVSLYDAAIGVPTPWAEQLWWFYLVYLAAIAVAVVRTPRD